MRINVSNELIIYLFLFRFNGLCLLSKYVYTSSECFSFTRAFTKLATDTRSRMGAILFRWKILTKSGHKHFSTVMCSDTDWLAERMSFSSWAATRQTKHLQQRRQRTEEKEKIGRIKLEEKSRTTCTSRKHNKTGTRYARTGERSEESELLDGRARFGGTKESESEKERTKWAWKIK